MKIHIKSPGSLYTTVVDPDVNDVRITHAYIGPTFVTIDGATLAVCMRDNGFELVYRAGPDNEIDEETRITLNAQHGMASRRVVL